MKFLIKRVGNYLHSYAVVPNDATVEFKQQTYYNNFGTVDFIEVDEEDMYSFGVLKSEFDEYRTSNEYRGENPSQELNSSSTLDIGLII